jgi:hypothetical protein
MKVRELIEKLKDFDEDYEIEIRILSSGGYDDFEIDEKLKIVTHYNYNKVVIKNKVD